jgi:hypothetical protein
MTEKTLNRYSLLIEEIFMQFYQPGKTKVPFKRTDIESAAVKLGIDLPKNLGDVIYSFRYRTELPETITSKAPAGYEWVIVSIGKAKYQFELSNEAVIIPRDQMAITKIPDSTPGVILKYALDDEQSLLAKIRYNRLIDIFTGVTCYSLQNHLRTTAPGIGQVETDEVYIGIDKRGVHYIFPVQAKSGSGKIGIVQIRQDYAVCLAKLPDLICRPIAAQYAGQDVIALLEFEQTEEGIQLSVEKHYKLVHPDELSSEELETYRQRLD